MNRWCGTRCLVVGAIACWTCAVAIAHPAIRCVATLRVGTAHQAEIELRFDLLSYVLNEEPSKAADTAIWALVDAPQEESGRELEKAAARLERGVELRADGGVVPLKVQRFPNVIELGHWRLGGSNGKPSLPWLTEATLAADLPAGVRRIDIRFPEVLGDLVLALELSGQEARAIPLAAGERSQGIVLNSGGASSSRASGFARFVRLGIEHIVPFGLDHVLFIVSLLLASPRLKSLFVLITLFTVAHSVTLALAATGVVIAPPRVVEPLIAVTIAAMAIWNLVPHGEGRNDAELWKRAPIVFGFGLVHGLGFAAAFREMELPRESLVVALVGFNVGVECGQIGVLLAAYGAFGWAASRAWYRARVVLPLSLMIACVAGYWAVTRAIGM